MTSTIEVPKKKTSVFKRIWTLMKLFIFLVIVVLVAIGGAFIDAKLNEGRFVQKDDEISKLQGRVNDLVKTIEDLEQKNNGVVAENQALRDQLKTEEEKRREEELKKQLIFETKSLGKRLMTFQMTKPKFYFEYDNNYGEISVVGHPAVFSDNVVADGIEITFKNTNINIYIEPWKLSGLAFEKVSETTIKSADNKDIVINVMKITEDKYLVSAVIAGKANSADSIKLMINKEITKEQLQSGVDEVRDLARSVEITLEDLN